MTRGTGATDHVAFTWWTTEVIQMRVEKLLIIAVIHCNSKIMIKHEVSAIPERDLCLSIRGTGHQHSRALKYKKITIPTMTRFTSQTTGDLIADSRLRP